MPPVPNIGPLAAFDLSDLKPIAVVVFVVAVVIIQAIAKGKKLLQDTWTEDTWLPRTDRHSPLGKTDRPFRAAAVAQDRRGLGTGARTHPARRTRQPGSAAGSGPGSAAFTGRKPAMKARRIECEPV